MEYYINCMQNYAKFSGRARRKEYWMFALFNGLISFCINMLAGILEVFGFETLGGLFSILAVIYGLAVLIPSLAVCVRRLHDIGKSGWWYFIGLLPIVGWIILFVYAVTEGDLGTNQYGPNPKQSA